MSGNATREEIRGACARRRRPEGRGMSSSNHVPQVEGADFRHMGGFVVLKGGGVETRGAIERFVRLADRSIRAESGDSPTELSRGEGDSPSSPVVDFLLAVLGRATERVTALTAVVEVYHIDPTFRDLYYAHYAKHLFDVGRFTIRITLFKGELDAEAFTARSEGDLSDRAVGSVVLCPINRGVVGRTLIRPEYIADCGAGGMEVRVSVFDLTVRGKRIRIPSFTYRQQDGEVMSCAEVSLLNLMCYYSNEFSAYAVATPSEILALERPHASERVVPSRGLDFYDMSRIMAGKGFFPRVYDAGDMPSAGACPGDGVTEYEWMNRVLSWYICSGIPVAVNVSPESPHQMGHSLLCVGRESWDDSRRRTMRDGLAQGPSRVLDDGLARAMRLARRVSRPRDAADAVLRGVPRDGCRLIDAADLDDRYVVVDDAQLPFAVRPLDGLAPSGWMRPKAFMVPLHRSMMLDAMQAHQNGMAVLAHEKAGVLSWAPEDVGDDERVVVRMFMCSARGYKRSRVANHPAFAVIYEEMVLSQFLWVFELFHPDGYVADKGRRRAFAEVVLETSSSGIDNPMSKVVFMRYPRRMYLRMPDGKERYVRVEDGVPDGDRLIVPYDRNLRWVEAAAPVA